MDFGGFSSYLLLLISSFTTTAIWKQTNRFRCAHLMAQNMVYLSECPMGA